MRRRGIARVLIVAGLLLATSGTVRAGSDWFHVDAASLEAWRVEPVAGDDLQVVVRPRLAAGEVARRIFVVYARASPAYDIAMARTLAVLRQRSLDVELTIVNFQSEDARGQAALARARDGRFDLIIAMGSDSTDWLWRHYRGGALPVVSMCAKDPVLLGQMPRYDTGSGTNFAFTSLNMPIDVEMGYVLQVKPNLKALAILVDSRNASAIETQAKPIAAYAAARGMTVLDLSLHGSADPAAELGRLMDDAVRRMARDDPGLGASIFWLTGSTTVFQQIATINAHAGGAAVLSAVPETVRPGADSAALSIGISFDANAHQAAITVADILTARARVGELPVGIVTPPDIAINFRKLREIGANVPLSLFEAARTIYDGRGDPMRLDGLSVTPSSDLGLDAITD